MLKERRFLSKNVWPLVRCNNLLQAISAMAHLLKQYTKLNTMADDPNKRGAADRRRVSQQPHEQAYQKRKRKEEEGNSSRSSSSGRGSSGGRSSGRKSSGGSE